MVRAWSDRKLASTTATAIRKIESVLPEKLKKEIRLTAIQVPGSQISEGLSHNLELVRIASDENAKLDIQYRSIKGQDTTRTIWPLILYFWGNKWTLGAWCELREAFRSFRVDLMSEVVNSGEYFEETDGKSLREYFNYQSNNQSNNQSENYRS
jgi:predicted DNA-binding transcriptional regulator YafY